ncbi:hypothetical protein GCM10019016_124060 [Streptomyces prasinosporus]|uniref:Uncharacterized protein n=1 Tax=Streptomyces prasinosporus TaxID=68256 RepID=A0ABP6UC19_9ACTN|nr:hypothetical protein GCM10010332_02980 [Streptomyces albogriseolus]
MRHGSAHSGTPSARGGPGREDARLLGGRVARRGEGRARPRGKAARDLRTRPVRGAGNCADNPHGAARFLASMFGACAQEAAAYGEGAAAAPSGHEVPPQRPTLASLRAAV